jgi:hypothetical protein
LYTDRFAKASVLGTVFINYALDLTEVRDIIIPVFYRFQFSHATDRDRV